MYNYLTININFTPGGCTNQKSKLKKSSENQ